MRSVNRITLIGHLASPVDYKITKAGPSVASFPLATNRNIKSEKGETVECTDYHRIVLFGPLADISSKYLSKGQAVYLEGKLVNNNYTTDKGEKRYRSEVYTDTLNILTYKKSKEGGGEIQILDIEEKNQIVTKKVKKK